MWNFTKIAFIDLEIEPKQRKIIDIGVLIGEQKRHGTNVKDCLAVVATADFLCGHHFLKHDFPFIQNDLANVGKSAEQIIDTLLLSPLLFPQRPYHALNKDYKNHAEQANNPLNDCLISKDVLESEIQAFLALDSDLQTIFYQLLGKKTGYSAFFQFLDFQTYDDNYVQLILSYFQGKICQNVPLNSLIKQYPVALAYALSLINCDERYAISPVWLLYQYPEIEYIFQQLRATPCYQPCSYCDDALNIQKNLQRYFGYPSFRDYDGKPLQAQAVECAMNGESLLAVFPTGGGKSLTFQVPALMLAERSKSLTVVVSPLQSLMKDQVDNLQRRGISEAVSINGLLDPIERQKAFERVADGSASLLYISPESLRSRSIERLILGRHIARFVIDEAHCFSAWGQDFRVDYLYIGEFIQRIQTHKLVGYTIPVSCFTATAKPQVIDDIKHYFKQELDLELKTFCASVARKNLQYQVLPQQNEEQKYQTLRTLIQSHQCPTIVYVSRTAKAVDIAKQLANDVFRALPYHGKMESEEKILHQNQFIQGETQIIVATSAFGMGVDKNDVGLVVHYQISDSLENYVQEAGRAGRDEHINAQCYVLFADDDLDKHFILLNQTKVSQKEIGQIWRALKELFGKGKHLAVSPLEIARQAGWNDENEDIKTRVMTAICALEDVNYVKRGQNMPQVFANSILCKNASEAIEKIHQSQIIPADDKTTAIRIIKKLFSQKSQKYATDESAESRVDYMADVLGLAIEKVIKIISYLRQEQILADQQDLQVKIPKNSRSYPISNKASLLAQLEYAILEQFAQCNGELCGSYKQLNQILQNDKISIKQIKNVLNYWKIKNWIKRADEPYQEICYQLTLTQQEIHELIEKKAQLSQWLIEYLYELSQAQQDSQADDVLVDFSLMSLQKAYYDKYEKNILLAKIEDCLFYLLKMNLIKIEGGFLVVYQRLYLERLEMDNRKQYTKEDYKKLQLFYDMRREQIHIVGKYAELMMKKPTEAGQLVNDYFSQDYKLFLRQYFGNQSAQMLQQNMTNKRFEQWFGHLSSEQLQIIQDNQSQYIVVFATAGSGKTRVLVHKLASLYQMEDIKHEQLLMLTFSRAAAYEFRTRLFEILGSPASFIEIKTFHSYCFDLLGRVGDLSQLSQSNDIIAETIEKIKQGEVEESRIAKLVLVIDEAQDINQKQFELIQILMQKNEEMRVIAVGDDDQTIYTFMGASPDYMRQLCDLGASRYYLTQNYRSASQIVEFANHFAKQITIRLKNENITAVGQASGMLNYVAYQGDVFLYLLENIQAVQGSGNIAILTQTNKEAEALVGRLRQNNIACQLVQGNEGFKVKDLLEVRVFEYYLQLKDYQNIIDNDVWENAKLQTKQYCQRSCQLFLLENILSIFEQAHPNKKYLSDWQIFIKESKLENFYQTSPYKIFVSTIHKAKGREFDHVFVYLNCPKYHTDEQKRLLYVAFSRAKTSLHILSNDNGLYQLCPNTLPYQQYHGKQSQNQYLFKYLTHKDVNLGYFINIQQDIHSLQAGDILTVNGAGVYDLSGRQVLKFSKSFVESLNKYYREGYVLSHAEVNFIVLWYDKNTAQEYRIVLPIIHLRKT